MFLLSLDITWHFDVLIFMPHFLQACSSLSVAIWRWSTSWSRSVVSSAYLMLFRCIWPIWIPLSRFWTSFMISSRKRLNKLGDSRQPWRTPVITSNHSLIYPLTMTAHLDWLYMYSISSTRTLSAPIDRRHFQRASRQTVSKAALKSTKFQWIGVSLSFDFSNSCLTVNMASVVPRALRNPHCSSVKWLSMVSWILVRTILQKTFPGMDSSAMAL